MAAISRQFIRPFYGGGGLRVHELDVAVADTEAACIVETGCDGYSKASAGAIPASDAFQWLAEMALASVQPALRSTKYKTTPVSLVQFQPPWSWELLHRLDRAFDELYTYLFEYQEVAPMHVQVRKKDKEHVLSMLRTDANGAAKRACTIITL